MKIVKWITDDEIELEVDDVSDLERLRLENMKYYKHPKAGTRRSKQSYYLRYISDAKYSTGAYSFPRNEVLERLCLRLHGMGFAFWGTFKTEIAPYDYMRHLQWLGVLNESFYHLQAGEHELEIADNLNS